MGHRRRVRVPPREHRRWIELCRLARGQVDQRQVRHGAIGGGQADIDRQAGPETSDSRCASPSGGGGPVIGGSQPYHRWRSWRPSPVRSGRASSYSAGAWLATRAGSRRLSPPPQVAAVQRGVEWFCGFSHTVVIAVGGVPSPSAARTALAPSRGRTTRRRRVLMMISLRLGRVPSVGSDRLIAVPRVGAAACASTRCAPTRPASSHRRQPGRQRPSSARRCGRRTVPWAGMPSAPGEFTIIGGGS